MTSPKMESKVEAKSGLAFDLILDNPKCPTPAKLAPSTPTRILTNEDIKNKLQKAEERRQVRILNILSMRKSI
jgi:hypothetical protein